MQKTLNQIAQRFSVLAFMLLAALSPVIALAQTPAPAPKLTRMPPVWLGYLLIAILLVIVMAVSLMPSKRSHQD